MTIRLRDNYDNSFEQWLSFSETYGLAKRLGYETETQAWEENPKINVGVNPGEFRIVGRKFKLPSAQN